VSILCLVGLIKSEIIGEAYPDSWNTASQDVWCVAVIRWHGLLLELIDEKKRRYRRVGLFIMPKSHWEMEPRFAEQGKIKLETIQDTLLIQIRLVIRC
jgi:hypothetical protein